jgi:PAS domain S-box-containing protein
MLDRDGFVTTWNSGAERMKGYSAQEIIGKHFSLFYPPGDVRAGKPAKALEMAATLGEYKDESLRVRKDGALIRVDALLTALHDANGGLCGFAKVTRDITERRETTRRLRNKERLVMLGTTAAVFAHEIANPLNALSTSLGLVTEIVNSAEVHDPVVSELIERHRRK